MARKRVAQIEWLLLLLAYLGIAVVITWPLVTRLSTHLPDGTDSLLHYWNGWWSLQAFRAGQLPYNTPYLFYPNGVSMVYHNFAWIHILIWMGLRPLTGGIAAYNLTFLLNLTLCGIASFYLAYELTSDKRAAFLAGLIYQAWPYRLTQPSHPNMMSTWAIPIFVLFLTRVVQNKRWQDGVWAGVALALVGYMRWQLLIPAALIGGLYLILTLANQLTFAHLRVLFITGIVTGILLLPPLLLLANEWQRNPADLVPAGEELAMQTDVLAYGTPPGSHFLVGNRTQPVYERFYADRGSRSSFSPYIGVMALLLVGIGVGHHRRRSLPWVGIALMLMLLALGPTLRINGQQFASIPMPYNLLDAIIPIRLLREPDRFNMFLALPVSVLAAYGVRHLLLAAGSRRLLLTGILGGILFLEYLTIPLPLQSAAVSSFYSQIAEDPADFALLNIPVDPYKSKPYMFAQAVHARPILQGHASRYPQNAFAYLEGQPWLSAMQQFSDIPPKQTNISDQMSALAADGVRFIVLHKDLIAADQLAYWKAYFVLDPYFEDGDIVVYETTPRLGSNFAFAEELIPGLGIVRVDNAAACWQADALWGVDVAWGTGRPIAQDFDVQPALVAEDGAEVPLATEPMRRLPSASWQANTVTWTYYDLALPDQIAEGRYRLELSLVDPATGKSQSKPVRIQEVSVQSMPCSFALPEGVIPVNATFGDELRLPGYQLHQDAENVTLTVYWHSDHRMDVDYKVFVHIFDPATGIPAAQDDAMPRRWGYPTTFWKPGETVDDAIPISISQLPAGEYGVAIGVYHPDTGERLTVLDSRGAEQADGRYLLESRITIR